jgi:hypothetical protein
MSLELVSNAEKNFNQRAVGIVDALNVKKRGHQPVSGIA